MCVFGEQAKAPYTLQVGMRIDAFDQPFTQCFSAMCLEHLYVGYKSKCSTVGNDAGVSDLRLALIQAEAEGMLNGLATTDLAIPSAQYGRDRNA